MKRRKKIVGHEVQFKVGPVILDVLTDAVTPEEAWAEAVEKANASLHHLDGHIAGPGNFERVQINIGRLLTVKDIIETTPLHD